ncbi:MAG TPA: Ca2+-dependent phosphoinositide-specific phospholipase C [Longimicrobiales bacterium]|nr:Ca2+-dependent phosphoinositide-specific phospholipase C [Longimicrobiales bacterium]
MTFEDLRYDQLSFKASHNTIDRMKDQRRWSIGEQLGGTGDAIEPVLGLEFDLHQIPGLNEYHVKHDVGATGPEVRDVLREVVEWCDAHPDHPVVTIHLDLKNSPGDDEEFIRSFDEMLLEALGEERVYRPASVIGGEKDVIRGAQAGNWATFRELRGKVILCLSGAGDRKHAYANHEPEKRVCFADFAAGSRTPPRRGNQVFVNLFVDHTTPLSDIEAWTRTKGFIVRAYNLVARRAWDTCVEGGVNILSTDVLDNRDYVVSGVGFAPLRAGRRGVPANVAFGRAREGHHFRNWSRTVEFNPGRYVEPRREAEIQEMIRRAEGNTPIRTQGAGHSFSQILTTDGTLVSLDSLVLPDLGPSEMSVDGKKVTVSAGIRMKHLIPKLKARGLGLRNMGSVTEQSIAGAVSTGTHGTGLGFKSMPTQVTAARLIDGRGDFQAFDESTPEMLGASRLSLGMLGILTSVTLECVDYYKLDFNAYLCDFQDGVDQLVSLARENERMLMWWMMPFLPRHKAIIVTKNEKGSDRGSLEGVPDLGDAILARLNLGSTETIPMDGERLSQALGDDVGRSGFQRILHRTGGYEQMLTLPLLPVFHRELEYAVPVAHAEEALRAIDRIFAEGSVTLNLGCEIRFVAGDDDLLSATQGEDVCYIGVSSLNNAMELFQQIEPVFRELGGRPHWGKHYNLTRQDLEGMYGDNHARFAEIRREMDPDGIFLNSFLERLFA